MLDIYQFPKTKLPAKSKKEEYTLAWAKAIYSFDNSGANQYLNTSLKDRFKELERYGNASQDPEKYRDVYTTMDTETRRRKGYTNINEDIIGYATKLKNGVMKLLTGNGNKLDVALMNDDINNLKAFKKAEIMAKTALESQIKQIDAIKGTKTPMPDFKPSSKEDLAAFEEAGGLKLSEEIALELALQYSFEYDNNWERTIGMDIKEKFMDIGVAGVYVYLDPVTRTVKFRELDPKNLIIDTSNYIDFRDAEFFGEIIPVTVNDFLLAYEAEGKSMSEEDAKELVKKSSYGEDDGKYKYEYIDDNNWYDIPKEGGKLDNRGGVIKVLDFIYKSIDVIDRPLKNSVKEVKVNKNKVKQSELDSGKIYKKGKYYYKKIKVKKTMDVVQWRRGKWVIGTDVVYDFGLVYNQVRNDDYEPIAPFVVERLRVKSIMEVIKPNLDALQIDMLKLQMFKSMAAPSGIAIEIGSISNITLGGEVYNPKDILKLRQTNGTYFYKMKKAGMPGTVGAGASQALPFQETEGGMGRAYNELLMDIDFNIRMMQDNTGLSDIALAQTPNSEMGLGLNQMSLTASENIISNIYYGYKSIKERVANITALHIMQIAKNNPKHNIYSKAVGNAVWKKLAIKDVYSIKTIGIKLRDIAKNDEIQFMHQLIQQGLQVGRSGVPSLTSDEAFLLIDMIKEGKPLKYVNIIMRQMREKREKEEQAKAERNIQLQGQQNMQMQQQASQAEQQKLMEEIRKEITIMKQEYDLKLRNLVQEKQLDMQETQLELQSKEKIAYHSDLQKKYDERAKTLNPTK